MSNLENTSMDAKLDNLQIVTFLECIISFFQRGEARIEFRIVIFPRISLEKMPDSAPRQCQRGSNKDGSGHKMQDFEYLRLETTLELITRAQIEQIKKL